MAFRKAQPGPITPEIVKQVRAEAELTQAQAAELVHSSVRSWQKWEQGEREMPMPTFHLFLIRAKLGDWPEYLGMIEEP